jgi:hypothetical protein
MTSIRTLCVGTAVVALLGGGAAVLATAGSATAGTPTSGTFTVRAHHGADTNIDLGPKGFSAGDEDLFTGALTRHGKHVGRYVGNCTTARVSSTADQLCEFVLHLGKAQITAAGTVRSTEQGPGTFQLPVLGGTGRYQGADGQITVTATGGGSSFPMTISVH